VTALIAVVGVAVLREGAEVVLFLYGIAASGDAGWPAMLTGGAFGILLGVALSAVTYAGLVRLPVRRLFAATGALITLLAAGLAAQVAALLQDGGVVNVLSATIWDTSDILSDHSLPGRVLHTLVGYSDRPTGLQAVTYLATLGIIIGLGHVFAPAPRPAAMHSPRPTVTGA
jgi:high-affinity iron transporter